MTATKYKFWKDPPTILFLSLLAGCGIALISIIYATVTLQ
jgi:hypothetical protein